MNLNRILISPLINYQSVRYVHRRLRPYRKPFWLGIAKSKITKVPQPKSKGTPEECLELNKLVKLYNTQFKSLRTFIKEINPAMLHSVQSESFEGQKQILLEKQMEESYTNNIIFNKKSAELREKRLEEFREKCAEEVQEKIKKHEEEKLEKLKLIEETVRLEKEKSKYFITPENVDEAIEKCLNNEVDYNFAIDLEGNKYFGKEPITKILPKERLSEAN